MLHKLHPRAEALPSRPNWNEPPVLSNWESPILAAEFLLTSSLTSFFTTKRDKGTGLGLSISQNTYAAIAATSRSKALKDLVPQFE